MLRRQSCQLIEVTQATQISGKQWGLKVHLQSPCFKLDYILWDDQWWGESRLQTNPRCDVGIRRQTTNWRGATESLAEDAQVQQHKRTIYSLMLERHSSPTGLSCTSSRRQVQNCSYTTRSAQVSNERSSPADLHNNTHPNENLLTWS